MSLNLSEDCNFLSMAYLCEYNKEISVAFELKRLDLVDHLFKGYLKYEESIENEELSSNTAQSDIERIKESLRKVEAANFEDKLMLNVQSYWDYEVGKNIFGLDYWA